MRRGQPLISVVIPTRDRAAFLERTLACLSAQTMPRRRYEVLVVDDGSRDDTKRVARSFEAVMPLRYLAGKGGNAGAARNLGIRLARGAAVLFMDDECLAGPGFLEAHCRAHERNRHGAIVRGPTSPILSRWDEAVLSNVKASGKPVESRARGWILDLDDLRAGRFQPQFPLRGRTRFYDEALAGYGTRLDGCPAPWFLFLTRNVSVPTAVMARSGGFDEELRGAGLEDMEMGYRLHRLGIPFALAPDAPAYYQVCAVSKERKARRLAEHYRTICGKHEDFGIFTAWKLLTGQLDFTAFNREVGRFQRLERSRPEAARSLLRLSRQGARRCGQRASYLAARL